MKFIWQIDDAIFRLVGRGVEAWCNLTGTSNFFLARMLLMAGWVLFALYFAIRASEGALNSTIYATAMLFLVGTIGSIFITKMIEQIMRNSEESDALPPTLRILMWFTQLTRIVLVAFWVFGFILLVFGNVDLVSQLVWYAFLLHGIHYYVIFHVNTGGKKRALRLAPSAQ